VGAGLPGIQLETVAHVAGRLMGEWLPPAYCSKSMRETVLISWS
jgi:hypothetical protein